MNTMNPLDEPLNNEAAQTAPRVIYNSSERYCTAQPNQICFISDHQTMHLTMGSCISTVFIGRNGRYILAANHIVIAKAREGSPAAKKGAYEQIHEIVNRFKTDFGITKDNIRCVHIIGAGTKKTDSSFKVHIENARETDLVLGNLGFNSILADTNSFVSAIYSISRNNLSVFIENNLNKNHISYAMNIDRLFDCCPEKSSIVSSALRVNDPGFESLVESGVIFGILGSRNRL